MSFEIKREGHLDPRLLVHGLAGASVDRFDDAYVLVRDGAPQWQVAVCWGENRHYPFRAELVWETAGVVVIGGGTHVYFLDAGTATETARLEIPCGFGHLELDPGEPPARQEALYVLGWTDIVAVERTLATRWWARDVAVDGVVFVSAAQSKLTFSVEMDPPGGWFQIELDATTGNELARRPAFTEDYRGLES
jgi:hypothetical protein